MAAKNKRAGGSGSSSSAASRTGSTASEAPTLSIGGKSATGSLARHRIRQGIERLILSGQLKPGQRLVQLDLAAQFGVAQSVIRESLLELQFGGLVRTVDNLGMFVADMDLNRLLQAYQIREMFEGLAARQCCETATRADVREMYMIAEQNLAAGKSGDLEQRSVTDRQFHFKIVTSSRNDILAHLTESYRALGMVVRLDRPLTLVHEEHVEIVKAIEQNKPVKAEKLAREHVAAARAIIEQKIAENSFTPNWVMPNG